MYDYHTELSPPFHIEYIESIEAISRRYANRYRLLDKSLLWIKHVSENFWGLMAHKAGPMTTRITTMFRYARFVTWDGWHRAKWYANMRWIVF